MRESSIEAGPLLRARLDVSYDGTDFSGWAAQPGRRTVQGELEQALATALRVPAVALTVAGRTDAGVHATGQVAHCDLRSVPAVRNLNGLLPDDVRVRAVTEVGRDFDARFSALWRRYEYRLTDEPVDPRRRGYVLAWPRELDVAAMASAAEQLVGLHDFAAFCKRREGATSIRHLTGLTVTRDDGEIVVGVQADAFCHSMVRSLVGALLAVGERRRVPAWPASLLGVSQRVNEVLVAPAHGLTLVEVGYPPPEQWAQRAGTTRARRETT